MIIGTLVFQLRAKGGKKTQSSTQQNENKTNDKTAPDQEVKYTFIKHFITQLDKSNTIIIR